MPEAPKLGEDAGSGVVEEEAEAEAAEAAEAAAAVGKALTLFLLKAEATTAAASPRMSLRGEVGLLLSCW